MEVKYVIESTGLFVEYEWLVDTLSVHGVVPCAALAWVPLLASSPSTGSGL